MIDLIIKVIICTIFGKNNSLFFLLFLGVIYKIRYGYV